MLVISPNYSLSLYQSDQTLGTKRSTDDDPGKKDIPFIWYDFSSFSRLGKKPADHFQLLHTICPSVKQSLGPGIFCHPIASQPCCGSSFSPGVCWLAAARCSPCWRGFGTVYSFFRLPASDDHQARPGFCGKVFSGCFYSPIRACKRIFSYFLGNVLFPGRSVGCRTVPVGTKWLSVAFYTRFGQTTVSQQPVAPREPAASV